MLLVRKQQRDCHERELSKAQEGQSREEMS